MNLLDHLSTWPAADLADLLAARPDLLPAADRGLPALARKAQTAMSLGRALVGADVGMLVVAEALVARHPATVVELDELLGTADPIGVDEAVERLRRAGVVVTEAGVVSPVGALADLLHRPLGLGPSFVELADHLAPEVVDRLAALTRADGTDRRSAAVRAVAHRLSSPAVLEALLGDAPAPVHELLADLVARRSPAIPLPTGFPYRRLDDDDPLGWLIDRGLVVPVTETGAELPREVVMAARPGGLAPTARLRPVELRPEVGLAAELVAGRAADAADRLLDGAETLLRLVDAGEVSLRKTGGVGPRELGRLARSTAQAPDEVARLLELLSAARLVAVTDGRLTTTDLSPRWWTVTRHRRYLVLIRAWLGAERFLSRGLDGGDGAAPVALGDREPVAAVAAARQATLAAIGTVEPGRAVTADDLAATVVWQAPNLWGTGDPPPETLVQWMLAEATLLGLVSDGAPAPVGRALAGGDHDEVERAAAAAVADDQERFVLGSDLTAVAFGPLAPTVARPLGEMTERSGDGAGGAPSFRFTEASLRRALDRGWTAESITAFLDEHSLAGVPQPLAYLLGDVTRRYGSTRVLPAQSVIVVGDEAMAVEIAADRRATGLALRLVAPTVLTSALDPVTVVESLRALGHFPVLEGSTMTIDRPGSAGGDRTGPDRAGVELPADWTGPPLPTGPLTDEIDDAVALLLEGAPSGGVAATGPSAGDGDNGGARRPGTDRPGTATADGSGPAGDDLGQRLRRHWGRPAVLEATVGGRRRSVAGIVVGLGPAVSVLTTTGVVDLPTDSVLTVDDPGPR